MLWFVFRCGPLIDLCRGPHVRHTGKIKSIAVIKVFKQLTTLVIFKAFNSNQKKSIL